MTLNEVEKLERNIVLGKAAINRLIGNEWGWDEMEGGDVYPREPRHTCRIRLGGPSCSTCDDYGLILEGWAALNGEDWA